MNRFIFVIFTIFLFFFMLSTPDLVFKGAQDGLMLWFYTVLPTLLPFLVIINVMLKTNIVCHISRFLHPFFGPLLHVSQNGCFAVLAGFLCGYPMGAKVTADLVKQKRISLSEGSYLLSFCNNTSPGFMVSFVICHTIGKPSLVVPSMLIFLCVPLLLSFLFRHIYSIKKENPFMVSSGFPSDTNQFSLTVIDDSIMDGFETITKVGGYIILFSVLLTLADALPVSSHWWTQGILPFLEITNGVTMIGHGNLSFPVKYAFIMGLCAFGGFCSAAQTQCMLSGSGLKTLPYIMEKLAAALATSFLSYGYIITMFP